jgi:hypothetical protein
MCRARLVEPAATIFHPRSMTLIFGDSQDQVLLHNTEVHVSGGKITKMRGLGCSLGPRIIFYNYGEQVRIRFANGWHGSFTFWSMNEAATFVETFGKNYRRR